MARRSTGGRLRAALFLGLSFSAAAGASITVFGVLSALQQELDDLDGRTEQTVEVLVASHDLGPGRAIGAEDLALVEIPPEYVPDGVMRTQDQAVGRVVRERVLGREYIREERLADPSGGLGLNAIIPRGMRAVSLDLVDGSAVSGFLEPGNYVDVLVTLPSNDGTEAETVTLLQPTTVLAVNDRMGDERGGTGKAVPTVTVAVTPEQAERLSHAFAQGDVKLTLRSDIDVTRTETHGAKASTLLGDEDGHDRITLGEWREIVEQRGTGVITIINGRDVTIERVQAP